MIADAPTIRDLSRPTHHWVQQDQQWEGVAPVSEAADWLLPTLRAVVSLRNLPSNWDGYGSPQIASPAMQTAQQFLKAIGSLDVPAPHVAPVTGGGIHFTWLTPGKELEIGVKPDGSMNVLIEAAGDPPYESTMQWPEHALTARRLVEWLIQPS